MTKLLERAIETMRGMSANQQDEIAQAILDIADGLEADEDIDPAALPGVIEGLADAEAGRFATEAEIETVYRRFDK